MKYLKLLVVIGLSIMCFGCSQSENKLKEQAKVEESKYVCLSPEQLEQIGIFIQDTIIAYNNIIEGVGSLDIAINDKSYYGNLSLVSQTKFKFYPRYITTLDTVQRAMYMLSGVQMQSQEEARKWQEFESLVPIVVEPIGNGERFGETLIFWMTKTPELEKVLQDLK
jgi:hypothetical protein